MTCPDCEGLQRALDAALVDLQNIEVERRVERRTRMALVSEEVKARLQKVREDAPERKDIEAIFREWVHECDKDPKRTKLGKDRFDSIKERLREGHTREDFTAAIKYVAEHPYRVYGVWQATGKESSRTDDLSVIAGSSRVLERLAELGRAEEKTGKALPRSGYPDGLPSDMP